MAEFKIAAAQVGSKRGDVDANVATHVAATTIAARHGISLLVFPELSLTGYEPDLADDLAITPTDERLDSLRALAGLHSMEIVVGAPLRDGPGKPKLGAIVIRSSGVSETYHKMHLGGSESSHFVPGHEPLLLTVGGYEAGLAICADSSHATHPEAYVLLGATIYAAGVFLTAEWYERDVPRLAGYAESYKLLTVMANHAGSVDSHESVGKSAIWSPEGELLVQAGGAESVLLIASSTNGTWQGEVAAL